MTIKPIFKHAGHTMGLKYVQESDGTFYIETVSVASHPIEDGTYPKFFAEGEAVDAITNLTMNSKTLNPESLANLEAEVWVAITRLISDGVFEAVN